MSKELRAPIDAYFAGKRSDDIDAMLAPFADAAIVRDVDQEIKGRADIREWMQETTRNFQYTVDIMDVAESATKTAVIRRLSGDFPGSPVEQRYAFALDVGRIIRLEIS
jgi:ketosteroid isomerase-like protein